MKSRLLKISLLLALLRANSLWALPVLQLDIVGGVYDTSEESTIATSSSFTLRALLKSSSASGTYYVSAALTPGQAQPNPVPNFGSVVIDGQTYSPSNFIYGTPPLDTPDEFQGNLPTHGIFPTYFIEFAFNFNSAQTVGAYNVQTDAAASGSLYYHDFSVNVSALLSGYSLHFDLYDERVYNSRRNGTYYTVDDFAPFSHDAESGHVAVVPDRGATLILIGLAFVMLASSRGLLRTAGGGWARFWRSDR